MGARESGLEDFPLVIKMVLKALKKLFVESLPYIQCCKADPVLVFQYIGNPLSS
jgi:hypothetical protein